MVGIYIYMCVICWSSGVLQLLCLCLGAELHNSIHQMMASTQWATSPPLHQLIKTAWSYAVNGIIIVKERERKKEIGEREKKGWEEQSWKRRRRRREGRKVFELLSCICSSGHETESRGRFGELLKKRWEVRPTVGRREQEGGPVMNGRRTGMRDGAAWKSIYGARSRSEDDETLIKVNELPELPG